MINLMPTAIVAYFAIQLLMSFAPVDCATAEENGDVITAECQAIADEWNKEFGQ